MLDAARELLAREGPAAVTHQRVARQAGVSRSFYAQVEHARQAISVDRAFAIANALGVEMTELFTAFPPVPHARPY